MMGVVSLRQRIALELQRQLTLNCAREHPLREIFWECTLRCCLECRHCGSDCKVTSGLKDMPFADFEMVLRRINEAYGPEDKMVILSGGEPLMRAISRTASAESVKWASHAEWSQTAIC